MISKPSARMAAWIHKNLVDSTPFTVDDVYDVLLSNISSPTSFVTEVRTLAVAYEEDITRHTL